MADPLPWPRLDPLPPGWLDDTPAAAVAVWRRQTPAQRWARVFALRATARAWLAAGERMRHPHLADPAIVARVRARLTGAPS